MSQHQYGDAVRIRPADLDEYGYLTYTGTCSDVSSYTDPETLPPGVSNLRGVLGAWWTFTAGPNSAATTLRAYGWDIGVYLDVWRVEASGWVLVGQAGPSTGSDDTDRLYGPFTPGATYYARVGSISTAQPDSSWLLGESMNPVGPSAPANPSTANLDAASITVGVALPPADPTSPSTGGVASSTSSSGMATTSASRFLPVTTPEPNLGTGWQIHILDYKDMTSLVAICAEFSEMSFTQELNGTGTGSVTLDQDSPWWTNVLNNGLSNRAILNNEYVFEAWENGVQRFAWLGQTVVNTLAGDDETRSVTISGPGIAQVLTWACINRPGWPTKPPLSDTFIDNDGKKHPIPRSHSPSDKLPAFMWEFPVKWPTMRMWYTVFQAAQRRGLIRFVKPMFTALKDSGKQDWVWVKTIEEIVTQEGYRPDTLSESLLDFLNDCTGQDYSKWFGQRLEWMMYPGFKLHVQPKIGSDKSNTVRFFAGQILSNERTRDRENISNRVIAVDVDGEETIRLDSKSVARWNLREQRNETNKNVIDSKLRDQLADRYIAQSRDEKDEWAIKIPYDDPGRVPFRNFGVGDWIGFNDEYVGLTPSATAAPTSYRVMAITVSVSADQQVPDCELTLKSKIDSKMEEMTKQITRMLNEPVVVTIGNVKEISIPALPKEKSTLVYDPATGKWKAQPVSSTDGSDGSDGSGTSGEAATIYVQKQDPATQKGVTISAGTFWLETYD